ncbi:protein kinase domain containing protein [Stylonychia lemnae]|uniref:Protein kinase domain containing protein n=1 Tax=Stylonychia lemnae TaxID=5949 RepID=A0A078ADH5_STYLE|nr:protein kinase domain containing protein [Stylonychia lemnae]|eukprot:CDW79592.1 protein kinase domain containing protein [Stylonychia lemnae]
MYKYTEDVLLGQGGFGTVLKVLNKEDSKYYAMKIQKLKDLMTASDENYSTQILCIIREINTFKLNHPNITKFHESYFTHDDKFVIITELAESNLTQYKKKLVENKIKMTNAQITDIMIQIMKGTIYLHNRNIMHRDLSPDNILVFDDGQKFKLCDFGLSQQTQSSKSTVGKQNYKAPEIVDNNKGYTPKVDVWSAGIILYYLCTSKEKYKGKVISTLTDGPLDIKLDDDQKQFEPLLNKMLRFDPNERIDSIQVLSELCDIKQESVIQHREIREAKNNLDRNHFDLTIESMNDSVREIVAKLGEFNYGAIDNIHSNPDRIFNPQILSKDDGAIYEGEVDKKSKIPDGRGRYIYKNGTVCDGLWKDNLKNGFGRDVYANGDYYLGEYKDDRREGFGRYYWNDGQFYEGYHLNDKQEGLGYIRYRNGDQYLGQWANDKFQGVGVHL